MRIESLDTLSGPLNPLGRLHRCCVESIIQQTRESCCMVGVGLLMDQAFQKYFWGLGLLAIGDRLTNQ